MPDFGSRWKLARKEPLGRGGQGNAFLVYDANESPDHHYVAKVLNGPQLSDQSPRWKRLEEEIAVSKSFSHPNVVHVIDSGHTLGKGYPYFVMPFYSRGSLEDNRTKFSDPIEIFKVFAEICDGVAYMHGKNVVHRDLKPANIFLDGDGHPIVGDLGLCFRFDAESLTETMEVAAARWYGAPELRNGHLEQPLHWADVYSLGKLLYWLFTGRVYDRDEQDYNASDRKLAYVLRDRAINTVTGVVDDRLIHAGAFADEIIARCVRYRPIDRLQTVNELASKVRQVIARVEAGGHALDVELPQRCLFCGTGGYKVFQPLPPVEKRLAPADPAVLPSFRPDIYKEMRDWARQRFGSTAPSEPREPAPLFLICQHCGNVQQFRFDLAPEALENWRP